MKHTGSVRQGSESGLFSIAHLSAAAIVVAAAALAVGVAPAIAADVTATWTGGNGNWSDPNHWSSYPDYPNNGTTTYDAIMNVHGALAVDGSYAVNDFTLSGPEAWLVGTGTITVNGLFNWSGDHLFWPGPGGTVNAWGGVNITPQTSFSATFRGTIRSWGPTILNGRDMYGYYTGATLYSVYDNLAGATFDIATDSSLTNITFNNYGTFRKTGGTGTSNVAGDHIDIGGWNILFTNSGVVQVQTGTLALSLAPSTGQFDISAGATLGLSGTLSPGATITGDGTLRVNPYNALAINQVMTITQQVVLENGLLTGSGDLTLESLWIKGANGTLGGSGTTFIPVDGTVLVDIATDMGRPFFTLDRHKLENAGSIMLKGTGRICGSSYTQYGDNVLNNASTGTIDLQADGVICNDPGYLTVNNDGLIRKSGGTGTSWIDCTFSNTGTVEAQTGTMEIRGGNSTGRYSVLSGAALTFTDGTYHVTNVVQSPGVIDGDGAVAINGGTVRLDGQDNVTGGTTLSSGRLQGTGSVANLLTVSGGTLAPGNSAGVFTVGSLGLTGGTLEIEVTGANEIAGVDFDQLIVNGDVTGLATCDLIVKIAPGLPLIDEDLAILTTESDLTGQAFKSVTFQGGDGSVVYGPHSVKLCGVPEPATLALLAVGGLLTLRRRRQPNNSFSQG